MRLSARRYSVHREWRAHAFSWVYCASYSGLTCICLMAGVPTAITLLHDLQTKFFSIMTSQRDNAMPIRRRAYRNTIIVLLMGDNLHRHESHICMMMLLELIKCICFFGQQLFPFIFWWAKKHLISFQFLHPSFVATYNFVIRNASNKSRIILPLTL